MPSLMSEGPTDAAVVRVATTGRVHILRGGRDASSRRGRARSFGERETRRHPSQATGGGSEAPQALLDRLTFRAALSALP